MRASLRRILAMVLRHLYILRGSWPRILEMAYWPAVNMVMWGFTSRFFTGHSDWLALGGVVLIGGVLLWDVMFRGNLGVALSFMEEMWSRNLGHLFVSPLRPYEMVASLLLMSLIRTLIGIGGATLIAIPLFGYNIYDMGLPLIAFFLNLIVMGWAIGLMVSGIVLRYGMGAESIAWVSVFAIQPLCAIYYPVATLPHWLQPVALALPASHVFEGMRELLLEHSFNLYHMQWAIGLNLVFLCIGIAVFLGYFRIARQRGLLLQVGE